MDGARVKREQFIAAVLTELKDWDPRIVVAHAAHESGRFRRVIGWNNFWGIKTPKRTEWTGKVKEAPTWEIFFESDIEGINRCINESAGKIIESRRGKTKSGKRVLKIHVWAEFCDWYREREAVKFYRDFIKRLYPIAYVNRRHYRRFFPGLVSGRRKYATDPEYAAKGIAMYRSLEGVV